MATATATIQQNVLRGLGIPYNDTVMLDRALRWLNKTLDKIQGFMPDVEFLQVSEMPLTLVVGQATYALPSDFMAFSQPQIRNDSEGIIINIIPRDEFDRLHPDPSSESNAPTSDATLEYDRDNNRHILRFCPAPDATDVVYAVMRRWHPLLSSGQNVIYDKLETALEDGAIYHGGLEVFSAPEYVNYRQELKSQWLEAVQGLQQVFAIQKPHRPQIPTVLKKSLY